LVKVADAITAKYKAIDNADAAFFDQRRTDFTAALQPFQTRIAEIKQKFSGANIGSTESIFIYMAAALTLNLISPPEFMNAVAEGNDPPAAAVVEFQNQLTSHKIKALVYNNQTVTAVTTNVKKLAEANKIPLVGVSETLQPLTATFQDWQASQLQVLETALGTAT
jgi:zinc/manganese transport system substrate-binding protein